MALHALAFVAPGKATLRQTRRGPTVSHNRASVQVRNCGGCTRRELITGVVSGTSLNTTREIEEAVSSKARSAFDQQFARTMEVGMADYELHMRTVKASSSATSRSSTTRGAPSSRSGWAPDRT